MSTPLYEKLSRENKEYLEELNIFPYTRIDDAPLVIGITLLKRIKDLEAKLEAN